MECNQTVTLNRIKVSVIVPIYNVKDYLADCLDSLERQTIDSIEVIMVNDGSTDGSEVIAATYSDRNPNFKLVNRDNGGLSAARNTGLEYVTGEYVYFLDGDDFLSDSTLETLYNKAVSEDLDQVRFAAYTFTDGTKDYRWSRDEERLGYVYLGSYPGIYKGTDFIQRSIDNDDFYPNCGLIITRRNIIEDNNLRFVEGIVHEDNLFNFQITYYCNKIAVLNQPLHYRRYRTGSIISSPNYLMKIKSMCISAEETDKFVDVHPDIPEQTAKWLNWYYALFMLEYWEKLPKDEQKLPEVDEYFKRLKPLLYKYGNMHLSVKLFNLCKPLYRSYKGARRLSSGSNNRIIRIADKISSIKKDPNLIFWIFTPVHGNIGDQAIAVAERKMLEELGIKYFEVTGADLFELKKQNMLNIFNFSPILFHGGGFLGTLWFHNEELVRDMITANPDSSILFFPNTVYFDDNQFGQYEYRRSTEIYKSHKDLKIYARESKSFNTFRLMGISAGLVPDIVMSLKEDDQVKERSGCLLLLRNDCEKIRTPETDNKIIELLEPVFGSNVALSDNILPDMIPVKNREREVFLFLDRVRKSELVVTDRLHGMIFAAITGTPCIVLNSKSHKLLGCYEWLKDLDYICFCDLPDKVCSVYEGMPHGNQNYDNSKINELFSNLKEDILRLSK